MPTGLQYVQAIAEEAGRFGSLVTTTAGTTTTLVCAGLVNSVLSASEYASFWVLIEDGACAGEVGQLTNSPLTRTSGTLTTATAFSSSIASGVTFSLYDADRLPPLRIGVKPGGLEIANETLRLLWEERNLSLVGVSGQKRYTVDTTTSPWLTDQKRIIEIRYPTSAADDLTLALNDAAWTWEQNGQTYELVVPSAPFTTGQTGTIKAYGPANTLLKLQARLRAVLTGTGVTSVTVLAGGSYTALPTITPSSGAATFTAVMAVTPGPITGVTVTGAGAYTATFPPALTVTRAAGDVGWANQTSPLAGLRTLTDEALADVADVKTVGLYLYFRALARLGAPGQTVAEWMTMSEDWRREATSLEHFGEPSNRRTNVASVIPVTVGVPRRWGRRAY